MFRNPNDIRFIDSFICVWIILLQDILELSKISYLNRNIWDALYVYTNVLWSFNGHLLLLNRISLI